MTTICIDFGGQTSGKLWDDLGEIMADFCVGDDKSQLSICLIWPMLVGFLGRECGILLFALFSSAQFSNKFYKHITTKKSFKLPNFSPFYREMYLLLCAHFP